eukprot:765277-Hanusia_phi.AAC.2
MEEGRREWRRGGERREKRGACLTCLSSSSVNLIAATPAGEFSLIAVTSFSVSVPAPRQQIFFSCSARTRARNAQESAMERPSYESLLVVRESGAKENSSLPELL